MVLLFCHFNQCSFKIYMLFPFFFCPILCLLHTQHLHDRETSWIGVVRFLCLRYHGTKILCERWRRPQTTIQVRKETGVGISVWKDPTGHRFVPSFRQWTDPGEPGLFRPFLEQREDATVEHGRIEPLVEHEKNGKVKQRLWKQWNDQQWTHAPLVPVTTAKRSENCSIFRTWIDPSYPGIDETNKLFKTISYFFVPVSYSIHDGSELSGKYS